MQNLGWVDLMLTLLMTVLGTRGPGSSTWPPLLPRHHHGGWATVTQAGQPGAKSIRTQSCPTTGCPACPLPLQRPSCQHPTLSCLRASSEALGWATNMLSLAVFSWASLFSGIWWQSAGVWGILGTTRHHLGGFSMSATDPVRPSELARPGEPPGAAGALSTDGPAHWPWKHWFL